MCSPQRYSYIESDFCGFTNHLKNNDIVCDILNSGFFFLANLFNKCCEKEQFAETKYNCQLFISTIHKVGRTYATTVRQLLVQDYETTTCNVSKKHTT